MFGSGDWLRYDEMGSSLLYENWNGPCRHLHTCYATWEHITHYLTKLDELSINENFFAKHFRFLFYRTMPIFLSRSITVVVALLLWKYVTSRKQRRSYPPGPKPKPLIGNLLDFPIQDVANVYVEWGKKYNSESNNVILSIPKAWAIGSVLHTSALGSHVVVVNKLEDAVELFERRAKIYSDRPEYPIQNL